MVNPPQSISAYAAERVQTEAAIRDVTGKELKKIKEKSRCNIWSSATCRRHLMTDAGTGACWIIF
ncbi:MAG: hypothetical protein PVH87_17785 [Desulfobacteraceae bacterium]|jgi:hypothetical protein